MNMKIPMKSIKRTNVNEVKENPAPPVQEKKTTKKKDNNLPPDTYKDEVEPVEIEINDHDKLVISVKRKGDLGLPHIDIRHYVTSETYTGFTKKGINFPIEFIDELYVQLNSIMDDCEKKGF
jgi:hypothetical protein